MNAVFKGFFIIYIYIDIGKYVKNWVCKLPNFWDKFYSTTT